MAIRLPITKEELHELYTVQRLTTDEIRAKTGISNTSISRLRKRWGIPTLDRYQSLVGTRHKSLEVLSETRSVGNGRAGSHPVILHCRCDCGKEVDVKRGNLPRTNSCGCARIPDLVGKRFGKLVVQSHFMDFLSSGKGQTKWKCLCDCGNTTEVFAGALRSASTVSCGCHRAPTIPAGTRFTRLVVQEKVRKDRVWKYRCKCDCGKEHFVGSSILKNGMTQSCGCLRDDVARKDFGEAARNQVFRGYRKNAKKRGLSFPLTLEEAEGLFQKNCHYCGAAPEPRNYKGAYGHYNANGIDRPDNARGYEPDNRVPCCTTCNKAKNTFTVEGFLRWTQKIRVTPPKPHRFKGSHEKPSRRDKDQNWKYRDTSSRKGREFFLTEPQVFELLQSRCAYCRREKAGGIDRLNSSKGYVPDNVAACCYPCNRAKLNLPMKDFLAWSRRIKEYQASTSTT